jgi:hypothetical protein
METHVKVLGVLFIVLSALGRSREWWCHRFSVAAWRRRPAHRQRAAIALPIIGWRHRYSRLFAGCLASRSCGGIGL